MTRKAHYIIACFYILVVVMFTLLVQPVSAQNYSCPNPGPYGICPPDTDIEVGEVTITDEQLLLGLVSLGLGGLMVVNGGIIRTQLARRHN